MSFVYTANALAFGGVLQKPMLRHHSEPGSVGCRAERRRGLADGTQFNYKNIVTFDEASVYVAGSQNGRYRNTVATALIRNLNLMNMVHIELLCARVTSEHLAVDDQEQSPADEPQFTFEGSIIDNVRIAGRPANITLDHSVFSRYPKHSDFVNAFGGPPSADATLAGTARATGPERTLAECYARRFSWPTAQCADGAPAKRGVIRCSLVDDIPDIPNFPDEDPPIRKPVARMTRTIRFAVMDTSCESPISARSPSAR